MARDNGKATSTEESTNQIKTISRYDIMLNDNPGILITHVQLKGKNYYEWASSIRTAS